MSMEFLVPSLCGALLTHIIEEDALKKRLVEILEIEEEKILVGFHQVV